MCLIYLLLLQGLQLPAKSGIYFAHYLEMKNEKEFKLEGIMALYDDYRQKMELWNHEPIP